MKKIVLSLLSFLTIANYLAAQITVPKLIVEETADITLKLRDSLQGKVKVLNGQLQLNAYIPTSFKSTNPNAYLTIDELGNVTQSNVGAFYDIISKGENSWIFHTPDDGRTDLYITPKIDGAWDWSKNVIFQNDGQVYFSNNTHTNGRITNTLGLGWGNHGASLNTDQGASIELRGTGVPYFDFTNDDSTDYDMRLILYGDNELRINGGNLVVNGQVNTEEVNVKAEGWPDFVFEEDYSLPTLEEVAQHIETEGHLIDIPNAQEIAKSGIDLGLMNQKLLQKIEELTLYTLKQQQEINQLIQKVELLNLQNK